MKLYKIEAVVLRARDCGNADKLLILYSREQGKIKVMAHGVSKPASRKRGATQLFSHSRFLVSRGRELDSISQGEAIEMFSSLRDDLVKIVRVSYLAELVDVITPEGEPNTPLFELLLTTMKLLDAGDAELLTRSFEIKAVSLLGYRPVLEQCANCQGPVAGRPAFSPAIGGVLCETCRPADPAAMSFNRGMLETLKLLLRWHPAKLSRLKIEGSVRSQIRSLLHAYIRYHLERDLKSAAFFDRFHQERAGANHVHV
ncbi:DNA repair protein RecO [Pelotomaculum terephthalicicum JT]|uniref:DNA repair protein RecO n=1 Tax=Pelotomaculum TaxID=191373 RepID=UPI0009D1458B|nr:MULTISPECIES: DNA repair protein RecO [Pelotomaculum]MCG9967055.1 DNA repair protein RecO [Pelotomaculum terephthalicicum JT]OPX90498.1 MAG: DNA repair protein RecO [Pelotomaculum sp. PtaB.Bin117]OPY63900.1 MAG: DNA repair protein RecO [Pelotomaculum sp. PtaU1.Bin065]